jgi:Protein of unknown function (DUF3987)
MLDVNEKLMATLYPNRCIMAKNAENKANLLKNNELDSLQVEKLAQKIIFSPVLEAKMIPQENLDNAFPVQSFPKPLQEIILQNKKCLLFPISYTGTSILYTASVAIGNTHWVRIKKGFQVPVVLYCALVGKVGVAKSHPLKFAIKPLVKRDSEAAKKYATGLKSFAAYENMSKEEKKKEEKIELPVLKKVLMQDFTPESLQNCHSNNLRGLGAYQDELMAWVNNFNRYAKGSAEQFWLSNQSGTFTDNHRTEKYTRIDYSFVSVMGTIQPELLKAFGLDRIYNGFLDRILFDYPVGLQKEYWTEDELSDENFTIYDGIIGKLLEMPFNGEPCYISFEKEAKKRLFEWQRINTDIANEKKNFETGICSKYDTILPRIALILQMLHDVCDEKLTQTIELCNVEKAIALIEYYRENARRVYAEILGDVVYDKKKEREEQKKQAKELYNEGKSLREIAQIVLGDERKKSLIQVWVKNAV